MPDESLTCAGCGKELTPGVKYCPKCRRLIVDRFLDRLGSGYHPELSDIRKPFRAQATLVEREESRVSKESERNSRRTRELLTHNQKHRMSEGRTSSIDQVEDIEITVPSKDEILIQGQVIDNRRLGLDSRATDGLYVALRDENLKSLPGMTKRSSIDENGYYSISVSYEDLETISRRKSWDLTLVVEDKQGKVVDEFETKRLSGISSEMLGNIITQRITLLTIEKLRHAQEERTREIEKKDEDEE